MSAFVDMKEKGVTFSAGENFKYSTSFQSPSCTLPTGGKGIEQETFLFQYVDTTKSSSTVGLPGLP